jgi:DNA-3-methyladenine glycosylase II
MRKRPGLWPARMQHEQPANEIVTIRIDTSTMRDAPKHRPVRPSSSTPREGFLHLEQAARTHVRFFLRPRLPFRLDLTVWALRRRPCNGIDRWDGATYSRVLVVGDHPLLVVVTQQGNGLEVTMTGRRVSTSAQAHVTSVLERLLGLRRDLHEFYVCAAHDALLNGLARRFSGLKPPRFPTVFEALLNGITCQQLSLTVGMLLLSRLAQCCGLAVLGVHACPRPKDLAGIAPEQLHRLGYSRQKSRAILHLAQTCVDRAMDLEALSELNDAEAVTRLMELRGIGPLDCGIRPAPRPGENAYLSGRRRWRQEQSTAMAAPVQVDGLPGGAPRPRPLEALQRADLLSLAARPSRRGGCGVMTTARGRRGS